MSRPKKAIVDYFPHFINHKKTISILENQFKNDGYAFWFKLLEILGGTNHHFIDCNEQTQWLFLVSKTLVSEETAKKILDLLADMNAIDKDFWSKKIIRSQNFIDNLLPVYQRREVNVYTKDELGKFLLTKNPLKKVSVNKKPQSKVKESKVKESKGDIYKKFCKEILIKYKMKVTNEKDLKEYFSIFEGYEGFLKMVDRFIQYINAFKIHDWNITYRPDKKWSSFIRHMGEFETDDSLQEKLESYSKKKKKKSPSPLGVSDDFSVEQELTEKAIRKFEEDKKNGKIRTL